MQEQDYELFDDYLSKLLDTKAVSNFEERLKTDIDFKNAFETYKQASAFLENKFTNVEADLAFEENVKGISETYFKEEHKTSINEEPKVRRLRPWYSGVAIAAVLLIGFFVMQQFGNPSYSDYADYETISLVVRGNQSEILSRAEKAFNNKEYREAANYFEELLKTDANNTELQLYQAVSLVELNMFDEADALFGKITASNSIYKDKAQWYLALSKLKQEDFEACKNSLKAISVDADDYEQAQDLLSKL